MADQLQTGYGDQRTEGKEGEVRILAFLCNWCSYAGADLAGVSRMEYPPSVMDIRVMCTATVSPRHVLKAFQMEIDGVLIAACHIGDCHYLKGNYMTHKRFRVTREVLKLLGIGEERLRLEWVSAAEGEKYAEVIRSFTRRLEEAGPSPLRVAGAGIPPETFREAFRLLGSPKGEGREGEGP